jgi:hypothetical protein
MGPKAQERAAAEQAEADRILDIVHGAEPGERSRKSDVERAREAPDYRADHLGRPIRGHSRRIQVSRVQAHLLIEAHELGMGETVEEMLQVGIAALKASAG